jgi:archaellum biogenesis ATPase FlaH
MAKASFASKDAYNPAHAWVGSLADVELHVGEYLSERADVTQSSYAVESEHGLHIRIGSDQFLLIPQSPKTAEPDTNLYSFSELKYLQIAPPKAVVEGLIYEGETILLAGRNKVGKSRLIQQMSLSMATGTAFLGMSVPKPRRVLIIDLENRVGTVRDRLLNMAGADANVSGLYVWCAKHMSDSIDCSSAGITKLTELIKQTGAEVLIIDPWRLFLGKDENNAEEIVNGLKRLSSLKETFPFLTIIIVHHVRKERFENPRKLMADARLWMDSISGHHALSSHVDGIWGLERERGDDDEEWIVFGGVARNTEPKTILLEGDESTLRFTVRQQEAALELLLTAAEKEIWKAARKLGQFTFGHLQAGAETKNKKALVSALKKATAQGLLRREGKTYTVVPA